MKNIHLSQVFCNTPRTDYSETLIQQLAQSIDSCGGLLRTLIVDQSIVEEVKDNQFEVLDGHIFYWAAVHAEANNICLSHVPCWVIDDLADMDSILNQLEQIASIGCTIDPDEYALPVRGGCS